MNTFSPAHNSHLACNLLCKMTFQLLWAGIWSRTRTCNENQHTCSTQTWNESLHSPPVHWLSHRYLCESFLSGWTHQHVLLDAWLLTWYLNSLISLPMKDILGLLVNHKPLCLCVSIGFDWIWTGTWHRCCFFRCVQVTKCRLVRNKLHYYPWLFYWIIISLG